MERVSSRYPEIPEFGSSIVRDFMLAAEQEVVPTEREWELLKQPLVGKTGLGESLFQAFKRDAIDYSRGYKLLTVKVFPKAPKSLYSRVALQSHEGSALVFNDSLAGIDIQLLCHEQKGVLSFALIDNNASGAYARVMYKDHSYRTIKGTAGYTIDDQQHEYSFIPTSNAQLVLLNIADTLLQSPHS